MFSVRPVLSNVRFVCRFTKMSENLESFIFEKDFNRCNLFIKNFKGFCYCIFLKQILPRSGFDHSSDSRHKNEGVEVDSKVDIFKETSHIILFYFFFKSNFCNNKKKSNLKCFM